MFLKKGGVTIEVFHPSEIARYKALGYKEPEKVSKPAEVVDVLPQTPEDQNAEAIKAVNESKATPKAKKGGEK